MRASSNPGAWNCKYSTVRVSCDGAGGISPFYCFFAGSYVDAIPHFADGAKTWSRGRSRHLSTAPVRAFAMRPAI